MQIKRIGNTRIIQKLNKINRSRKLNYSQKKVLKNVQEKNQEQINLLAKIWMEMKQKIKKQMNNKKLWFKPKIK